MKKNILLCTLGGSWSVVPEVYGFLAPDRLPLYRFHPDRVEFERQLAQFQLQPPDEIWVCTTRGKETEPGISRLQAWRGRLESGPVLRLWRASGTNQLSTRDECDRMRELLLRACLAAHEQTEGGQVVLSLAGGRKTMSADLQRAGQIFGCQALIHVVGFDQLPEYLRQAGPAQFAGPLPDDVVSSIVPVVTGQGQRSELLDVDMDGRGHVSFQRFPLPLPDDNAMIDWLAPETDLLSEELRERERAGSRLLGNYLVRLAEDEHHENWRNLYRLPPRVIAALRRCTVGPELAGWLKELPKADLHRHLGGCLDIDGQRAVGHAIWETLTPAARATAEQDVRQFLHQREWPADWPLALHAPARSHRAAAMLVHASPAQLEHNLYGVTRPRIALKTRHPWGFAAYERPGDLSGSTLLSHPAAIEPYADQIVRQARAEGLAYVELRGSPHKYGDGLHFLRLFHTALQRALSQSPEAGRPMIRFIVIGDRRERQKLREVIDMAVRAKRELSDFVAGLDLAGDEARTRPAEIAQDFLSAFEICLPLTIHAGEGEQADSIWQAAYHLHADRIGHGLSIGSHAELAQRFRDRGICLELCPTSNREVVGFRDPAVPDSADFPDYPLFELWSTGLPLTICTDNPGISRTSLADEYLVAGRMTGGRLSCWEALAMVRQAFVHAFLPSAEKEQLMKRVDAVIYQRVLDRFGAT